MPLHSIEVSLGSIDICNRTIGVDTLWEVPPSSRWMSYAERLVVEVHVDHLMSMVSAAVVVYLLALQFVLNTFTVGSIANKWEDWANTLNKKGALVRLCVVKRSLDVISGSISKEIETPT